MGVNQSTRLPKSFCHGEEVNFDHFQILRAIGKGTFSKVSIVQKKDTKQLFAMKYMNKHQCIERDALKNVLREVDILTRLEHPFLVNIWFSFQDEEDLFMVTDLLLGGDLRYHITQEVEFGEPAVILIVQELALALDYLQKKNIIHRDIKPENILLDEEGHAHITDFNIAIVLDVSQLATSMSGTKPYIAPEIFECAADACLGYSYPVDWWSLGVVAYEMLRRRRPFDIHSSTSVADVRKLFHAAVDFPPTWSAAIIDLIGALLCTDPAARVATVPALKQRLESVGGDDFDAVFARRTQPHFVPKKGHLNCDPTFELEEMILEENPLHKKKKRLAKQRSIREIQAAAVSIKSDTDSPLDQQSNALIADFKIYNRYQELQRQERERKEAEWERELQSAMSASDPLAEHAGVHTCHSCPRLDTHKDEEKTDALHKSSIKLKKMASYESEKVGAKLKQRRQSKILQIYADAASHMRNAFKDKGGSKSMPQPALDFIDRTPSPLPNANDS